ncbi:hypothetical protein DICPUDRAFT_34245 [Dictyostelium purpureum]|uniref:Condensation domain-containing protein n=1 Tax=Dictyostelium purpureum TaxID=5786 RepID=F0ZMC2_DICPU|nr:uncharacterized protein DICPUDRAFT_34245 [Dictyostelium purpureum]EGC34934.1 hypothetical protein DICPUDRAFT_34245 [Dictyostelium purpureum]|eukprot:XP_003288567.1 hypothetical protein DICPUDRAFT_34245 [Dictyostelium purpureum]
MNPLFNKEKNTVKFFPTKTNWERIMGPLENFSASVYTRGGLWFKGHIDIERFVKSMNESMIECDFLLSYLYTDDKNQLYACYPPKRQENEAQEQLEIEERKDSTEYSTLDIVLPKKIISPAQHSGFVQDLNGVTMGAFKLTIFNDGFVIGYNMNHTLFDQASIFYYLKYLSNIYSHGIEKSSLKKPYAFDSFDLENERIHFKNLDQAREYGANVLGFVYTPATSTSSTTDNSAIDYFSQNTQIKLIYDLEQIDKFKAEGGPTLSKNDIICALLFKAYTYTSHLSDDQDFTLRYANNIRSRLNMGEEAIGNLSHQCRMVLKVKDIREKSILDLARINRASVSDIKGDHFKDDYNFYKYMYINKENMFDYIGKPAFITSRVTNWTSFDYHNTKFDDTAPYSLRSHSIAAYGVNTISFDTDSNGKKIYTTPISIPLDCIDKVVELGKTTKLFTTGDVFK